ncbi:hypothetical protein PV08_07954 [Exophiala spinifera]|uniref:Carotenoid oxygenase n=1 Tax=Exophiala spinifera TaxID=91928 RepID=A0A0D1ZIT1_9EURO|nr:uncharacterized protein PV08_07954 [Exophiala spinifera]KIW12767.1 hypothetical protein PV08_07954 [Exophiala spinifera]
MVFVFSARRPRSRQPDAGLRTCEICITYSYRTRRCFAHSTTSSAGLHSTLNENGQATKALFGTYKNPWAHHPCVKGTIDSTANTNVILWANKLLALRESSLPWELDPDTLDTNGYDPFKNYPESVVFTAHPKIDPYTDELIVFGYEAKGPATDDVITYTVDREGKRHNELWLKGPYATFIHDCAVTENWVVLLLWPFEASIERMKASGHHFAYNYELPASFIVYPRRKHNIAGWKAGEYRVYHWKNCMNIHTAGGWEEEEGSKLVFENARVHDNAFGFFPDAYGRKPGPETKADFVRYEIDLTQPSESWVPDPKVILDIPCEFPRIDDRFISKKYDIIFLNVFLPERSDGKKNIFAGLNALAMVNKRTGKTEFYYPGDNCFCQEPTFIPRSESAPEGDGWIMSVVEQRDYNVSSLVFLDTREFSKPIAVAELPFRIRAQIHGNWVDGKELKGKPLVYYPEETKISNMGIQPF